VSTGWRLPSGGRIRREEALRFTFDGDDHRGCGGDTLASALLANGVHRVSTSILHHRPRGIFAAGVDEPNALVQLEHPFPEPMLTATTVELFDGLVARGLSGRGRLPREPDPARYDAMHAHCDVLVVGAGAAGLPAALAAADTGARVIVADEQSEFGGTLLGIRDPLDGAPAAEWVGAAVERLAGRPEVRLLPRTTVFGCYDGNYLLALERRTDHLGAAAPPAVSRQRIWRIRAGEVVLATGAHERPLVFADNDRPGTMLAGAARTYANRYAVVPGRRAVVFTTNDSAYAAAHDLTHAGVEVVAIVDSRPQAAGAWARRCADHGIEVLQGHAVVGTSGTDRVTAAHVAELSDAAAGAGSRSVDCDLLLVSGGWNPAVHLFSQAQGRLRFDDRLGAFVPDQEQPGQRVAGAARGVLSLAECLRDGAAAGAAAAARTGHEAPSPLPLPSVAELPESPSRPLWMVGDPGGDPPWHRHFVDLQRDGTAADVFRATGAGMRSVEHVKRYTTIGTSHEQGKTSGVAAAGVVAEALRVAVADLGTTTFRPPYTPVAFAALAGRDRGVLHDPVRVTPIHGWHVRHGAAFENVGQWQRPRYYPRRGEDMAAAVLRECRAARESVALMDVSTLGKIELQGPDAGEFLDRVYTNVMSTVAVGSIRYGVLCTADGMVFDDGTVFRLADDRFLATTTTGNAAAVLDWFEEWLQTEWPELAVHCTSVTEQWATVALVGPRSRDVLAGVAPSLAADRESFPFMTWRDATVAGIAARVARISFSGELAYEINVAGWDGLALWEALVAAGARSGVAPYGTEAMHVLRAEKAYPIVGQDTDGTVTPHDLGMGWIVSKKNRDFIGKRSFGRPDNRRADRKVLVGLLPVDGDELLPEGAQLVEVADPPRPPVPMIGHVTSSYRSAALGRTFALALVQRGRERLGQTVYAPLPGRIVAATVTDPVLYDPDGARRDG